MNKDMTDQPDLEILAYQEHLRRLRIEYQDLKEAQEKEGVDRREEER